jgi:hypothetical protein
MGFWNGRVTYTRYRLSGESPLPFGDEILEQARQRLIGVNNLAGPLDSVVTGWAGGDHVLDLNIEPGKNIIDDSLHLAIRIDADKIPGALLRAYTQIEVEAREKLNPSGVVTKAQRLEAKEAARIRIEMEAADGRFRRLSHYPILWDGRTSTLYVGSTSTTVLDHVQSLFRETFGRLLEPITAGSLARSFAPGVAGEQEFAMGSLEHGSLALAESNAAEATHVAWTDGDSGSLDFLGNEFLVWIWHALQNDGQTVRLADGSEVTVMLAKTLTLDCPRGETGRDQLTDDAPTRLPEALRALQAGKLPRRAGMILVRHGAQYELTLQAETMAVSSAVLPKSEGGRAAGDARIDRLESLRHLASTLDLLFEAFLDKRTSKLWSDELGRIRRWLQAA